MRTVREVERYLSDVRKRLNVDVSPPNEEELELTEAVLDWVLSTDAEKPV